MTKTELQSLSIGITFASSATNNVYEVINDNEVMKVESEFTAEIGRVYRKSEINCCLMNVIYSCGKYKNKFKDLKNKDWQF